MIVAQITDTHIAVPSSDEDIAAARVASLKRCIAAINGFRPRPDAVVHTGDLTQNGAPAEYALMREILAPLKVPFYAIPGNRDRRRAFADAFAADGYLPPHGGFLSYTVEHLAVRIVALDSVGVGRGHGSICSEKLSWLETTLAAAPERITVLMLHHPPFDDSHGALAGLHKAEEATAFAATLKRNPQVRRVLSGHAHLAAECLLGGTIVATMPSVAIDLRKDGGPTGRGTPAMIRLHTLDPQTGFTSRLRFVDISSQ